MSNIIIRNAKKAQLLNEDRQAYLSTLELRVYVNDVVPDPTDDNSQFDECTDSGYAPQAPVFGAPTLNGSNQGQMTAPVLTNVMTHSPGDYTVYGVFATDPADSDEWVYAARAGDPLPITAAGQVVQLAPKWLTDTMP